MIFNITTQENNQHCIAQISELPDILAEAESAQEAVLKIQTLALQIFTHKQTIGEIAADDIPVFYWRQHWHSGVQEIRVSTQPMNAPSNYRDLEPCIVSSDGDGLWETWHGSGKATNLSCGFCGNQQDNRQIYGNWGTSYPNGNSWDDSEIECGKCGKFTLRCQFQEG